MFLAIFGIGNTALNLAATLVVLVLVAIWVALIAFTLNDARRRIADPFLVGCAVAASLFPFVGTLVYTILRPPELLEDVREREIEIRESELRQRHLEHSSCHQCGTPVESDYVRCPSCRTRLKRPCPECSRPVGLDWKVCPYCEKTLVKPGRTPRKGGKAGTAGGRAAARPSEQRTARRGMAEEPFDATEQSSSGEDRTAEHSPKPGSLRRSSAPSGKSKSDPDEKTLAESGREPINRSRDI